MARHRISALVIAALTLSPFLAQGAASASGLEITNYEEPTFLYALSEPFTFTGTCPADVKKITVDYYVPKTGTGDWGEIPRPLDLTEYTLVESYVLLKYVPGSGAFIYRIHPTLNNLQQGTNVYVVTAERKDSTKLTMTMFVFYSEVMAERGGEEGAPAGEAYYGAERGGPDDGAYYGGERGGPGEEGGEPIPDIEPRSAVKSLPRSTPQESGLQAGYADDNAQFNYFVNFLAAYGGQVQHIDIPISDRIVLKIVDQGGKSVPNAKVTVSGGGVQLASGFTYADGTFLFFPSEHDPALKLFSATVSALGRTRTVAIDARGKREIEIALPPARPPYLNVPLDILFVLDTTGSMQEEIQRLKATIEIINMNLGALSSKPRIRFGMVLYRDRGDQYITRVVPFTADLDAFRKQLAGVNADGGGDDPEDLQAALNDAMTKVAWNTDGIRLAFVVTDAPPHIYPDESYTYSSAAHDARAKGIKIFTIGAGGLDLSGEMVLRQISQYTYAKYIFLTYGERGESEGGAPGSVSHHTGANFITDKLEAIVIRFAKEELSWLTNQPVEEEEDFFQAVSISTEDKAQTLGKLFDQAISQLVDYATINIPSGIPTGGLPIVPQAGASAPDAEYFSEQLVQSLARNATFRAVERKDLQSLLKELELQMSGITDEKNAAKLGKVMGAQMLLSSTMFDRGANFEIFMKLLRVETGEILSVTKLVVDKKLGLKGR